MSRIALVVRRVGGLEVFGVSPEELDNVVRRVGGLEEQDFDHLPDVSVVRRVGGLEDSMKALSS